MKVMQIEGDWGPEHIKPAERPDPVPGPGEIVIDMQATAINPRDLIMSRRGYGRHSGSLPLIPLADGAGVVSARGEGCEKFELGALVCPIYNPNWLKGTSDAAYGAGGLGGPLDGTQTEKLLIAESGVVRAPSYMTAMQAATLPIAALTAWNCIVEQGRTKPGDVVLVQGTGGVALFASQFAKMMGAEVILISSSDEKLERAQALGADHRINYRDNPDWHRAALEITIGRGVDHVVEIGGTGTLDRSVKAVRPSGFVGMIGVLAGVAGEVNLGPVVTRNIRLQGVTVGSREMFENMVRAIEANPIDPVIDEAHTFAFEDVGKALATLPDGKHFGKVVCRF
ncbi:MAG: NAD(P)-dependent alcohol dehydrogenase [Rhodospirillaceae bacterium]